MSTDPSEFVHPINAPTPKEIDAAAQAMDANFNPDRFPVMAAMFRDYAEVALTAAAKVRSE